MKTCQLVPFLLGGLLAAQTTTVFPDEYVNVPEGPTYSNNMPLAYGNSRVQCLYDAIDMAIPNGQQITAVGWREDGQYTAIHTGKTLLLEIRMGYSAFDHLTMGTNYANNYATTPVTVFGTPGAGSQYTLPDLRDPSNPLPNGQFFITLDTPFTYDATLGNLVVEYLIYFVAGGSSFTYRLDRSDYYSPVTYGPSGCQHSGSGIPNLTLSGFRPGQNFYASVTQGPANSFAILAVVPGLPMESPFSLQSLIGGIQPACTGQINLAAVLPLSGFSNSSGSKAWSFYIPNDPVWADFLWSCQAAFFDFGSPGGVVVSNGGEVLTGVRPRTSMLRNQGPPAFITTGSVLRYYNPVPFFVHQ